MNAAEYAVMDRLAGSHWYFVGKRDVLMSVLDRQLGAGSKRRLLDIGCGTGHMLEKLPPGINAVGLDRSPDAIARCRGKGFSALVCADAQAPLPFVDGQFDVLVAYDVLEHLDDEQPLLAEARRVLKPDGVLLVTVPAMRFLWSAHDVALGHHRRYERASLTRVLHDAGFRPTRVSYFNSLLFPIACVVRVLRRSARDRNRSDFFIPLPAMLNRALLRCFRFEVRLLHRRNLPFGLSLLAFAVPARHRQ